MTVFEDRQEEYDEINSVDVLGRRNTSRRHVHPKGWEPGVVWDGSKGTITSGALDGEPDPAIWEELIKDWGLDPNVTAVVPGSVQVRAWDANVSYGIGQDKRTEVRRMKYYRATLEARHAPHDRADIAELVREIRRKRSVKAPSGNSSSSGRALIVCLSDWQIGKGEGDGSMGSVGRILDSLDHLVTHIKDMKKVGRAVETVYLIGMGDLVEQCAGHYPMQAFQADLDRREQMRVVRRLILKYIDTLLPLVDRISVHAVPGNHGENRNSDGKAFTSWTDNDDLAVFDGVAEVMAAHPERYDRVSVRLADELSATFEAADVVIGISHMHAGRQGRDPKQKVMNWWRGHALGRGAVHDADILITGHYHHLIIDESSGRTWFQCPAQDPGSAWYEEGTGQHSTPGMLVFAVHTIGYGERFWGDMAVL